MTAHFSPYFASIESHLSVNGSSRRMASENCRTSVSFAVAARRLALAMATMLALPAAAQAERIANPVAEFTGVDKITGRIITFDVYVDETVQFGALQVTPRICYTSPETEEPKTDSFVEVDEITLDRKIRRIFSGWMFAESPGLNAVEHAVYDVWLKDCKQQSEVPPPEAASAD